MLQNKTFTKILSVVIALVLWVYVIGEVNPTTTQKLENIPVTLLNTENLASKGLVVLDGESFSVTLTIEGKRADILSIDKENLLVTADLFGYGIGENYIGVNVEVPNGITLVEFKPTKLKVVIDELVTEAKPVKVNYIGTFSEGVEPGQVTMKPETVEIKGARSIVGQVAYVGADVEVSDLTTEIQSIDAVAVAYSEEGVPVAKVKLANETIEVTARLMVTKEVPLLVEVTGQESADLQITNLDIPDTVIIRGDQATVQLVENITAKQIDLNQYKVSAEIPLEVFLPEGIELAEASRNPFAQLVIKGLSSKSFEYNTSVIKIEGLAAGFTAEIVPSNLIVSVADKDAVLQKISSTDVVITMNLQGMGTGAHQVGVKAAINGSTENITIGPESVAVNIRAND